MPTNGVRGAMPDMDVEDAPPGVNRVSGMVVDAAVHVHGRLGPGLLEKTYRIFLAAELARRGLRVAQKVRVPVRMDDLTVEQALELDILVEGCLVVEVKATSGIHPVHVAQTLTYLRMTGAPVGLVLNFNTFPLGIRRVVLTVPPHEPPPRSADSASSAAGPRSGATDEGEAGGPALPLNGGSP